MVFGGCGALNGYNQTQISKFLEMKDEVMEGMSQGMEDAREADEQESDKDGEESNQEEYAEEAPVVEEEDSDEHVRDEETAVDVDQDMAETDIPEGMEAITEMMDDVFNMSENTKMWTIRFGYIGMFLALIYFLGGLFLLIPKPFSIKLAYAALAVSVIFKLVQWQVLSAESGGIMQAMSGVGAIFSVVIDLILLAVIFSCEKHAYDFEPEFAD